MNTTDVSAPDPAPVIAPVIAAMVERLVTALTSTTATDRLLRIAPLADRAGLRVEGELDYSTLPALTRELASMASGGAGFCVDLNGLAFIDIAGLRVLVATAAALHSDHHVLTLRSAPPQVRRLLDLTGWHHTPGLHLQAPDHPG
jgi:anti-anti-sigma factor